MKKLWVYYISAILIIVVLISILYDFSQSGIYNYIFCITIFILFFIPMKMILIISVLKEFFTYDGEEFSEFFFTKKIYKKITDIVAQYASNLDKNGKTHNKAEMCITAEKIFDSCSILPFSIFKRGQVIFTTLGLIGTFIGLSQVFKQNINANLTDLFNSLDLVFNTSIIGICGSIIYFHMIYIKFSESFEDVISNICLKLDNQHFQTDIESLEETVFMLNHLCETITNLPKELEGIEKSMGKISSQMKKTSLTLELQQKNYEKTSAIMKDVPGSIRYVLNDFQRILKIGESKSES